MKLLKEPISLFHYTNFEAICGILKDAGFKFNRRPEELPLAEGLNLATPHLNVRMVCFCDIPDSQIERHKEKFGACAIGMKEDWVLKNKITPVKYIHKLSPDSSFLNKLLDPNNRINLGFAKEDAKKFLATFVNYEFYVEKEWRAVTFEDDTEFLRFSFDDIAWIVLESNKGNQETIVSNILTKKFNTEMKSIDSKFFKNGRIDKVAIINTAPVTNLRPRIAGE